MRYVTGRRPIWTGFGAINGAVRLRNIGGFSSGFDGGFS